LITLNFHAPALQTTAVILLACAPLQFMIPRDSGLDGRRLPRRQGDASTWNHEKAPHL